jgi:hypothetical protein
MRPNPGLQEGEKEGDPGVGGLLGNLNLEIFDAAQMDDLGGVIDDFFA